VKLVNRCALACSVLKVGPPLNLQITLTFPLYLYKKVPGQNPINNQNKLEFGFRVKHEAAKIQNKYLTPLYLLFLLNVSIFKHC
jgi:hypothetical protein